MLSSAQRYLAAVIAEGRVETLLKHGPVAHLFAGHEERLWQYFDRHVKTYGTLPDFALVKADTGFDLAAQTQPAAFYLDRARDNHLHKSLLALLAEVHAKHLVPGPNGTADPRAALALLGEAAMALSVQNSGAQVLDYRRAQDPIMQAFKAKMMDAGTMGLQLGWPTLDAMTGGLGPGDLIGLAGRPAAGKTWFMLWMALHAWAAQGKAPLFVSMEIKPLTIVQRLLAIHAKLPFKGIRDAALTTKQYRQMKHMLVESAESPVPFHVVDGNLTASVADLHALCRQLKPDFVVIDGAYLLTHPTERDRFRRVAENASLIKQHICDLAPTACSWQFARPAKGGSGGSGNGGNGKKQPQTGDEIGYTDAILQLSSLALGLMQPESAETIKQREVSILKGRNGETGSFTVNWNFDWTTDFSEVTERAEELEVE